MPDSVAEAGKRRIGVYAGTFDPITNGHFELIRRGRRLVDHLVVGVAASGHKSPLFSLKERVALVEADIAPLRERGHSIEVKGFESLLIHFVREVKGSVLLRGLRAVSDFDYEFQMTGLNAQLAPDIETAFLMASGDNQFISSSFIREICKHGGDVGQFVSPAVAEALEAKFGRSRS
jgi:pantetheine-phosphate adenylyltransferase